jgi:hypothetical protein
LDLGLAEELKVYVEKRVYILEWYFPVPHGRLAVFMFGNVFPVDNDAGLEVTVGWVDLIGWVFIQLCFIFLISNLYFFTHSSPHLSGSCIQFTVFFFSQRRV